jgi:hypothetical protein
MKDEGTYHDSKSVPAEETTVYVRNDTYSKSTAQLDRQRKTRELRNSRRPPNCSTDVALIWESFTNKVIGGPTNARDSYKDGLSRFFHSAYSFVKR